jgi:Tol biopolymer transport system component
MSRQSQNTRPLACFVFITLALFGCASFLVCTGHSQAFSQLSTQSVNGRLAFTSDGVLYTINADGTEQLQLTSNGSNHSPAWSPDGSKIAFSRQGPQDTRTGVYRANADGSGLLRLTAAASGGADPTWSPDGTKIAFASGDSNADIFVMNADGSNPINLTNNPAIDLSPAWSPDGSKIAFVSTRDFPSGGDVSKAFEIYVMTADGSNPIRLTNNTDQDADPSWSPDSSRLTFTAFRGGNFEIYAMNADGTSQVNLSNNSSSDFQPAWSPDGNRIAFLSFRDSVFNIPQEIYVMNSDGSNQTRLTNSSFAEQELAWQSLSGSPTPTPTPTATPSPTPTPDNRLVISQIYGGGGTAGATYQSSFLELINRGVTNVDLRQWSIAFTSATGTFNSAATFVGSSGIVIQPGQHVLIQLGSAGASGAPLPVNPDFSVSGITLGSSGKAVLTKPNTSAIGSACPLPNSGVADFVGFGSTANCFEGSGPVPTLSNTTAAIRGNNGCTDTDQNASDFLVGAPSPRNSSAPFNVCVTALQFSTSSYQVGEGVGAANITVNRIGDASQPATVDFLTSDGNATQNKDYEVASGTLSFASGETSKTFSVLIVDDVYFEGQETLNLTLSNPTGAVQGGTSTATLLISDNDAGPPTTNPLDNSDAQFFVRQHYADFLSRQPDPSGLAFWTGQITTCGSDQTCLHNKRIDVSNAFFYELEYQQTGAYVYRLYRAAFGNNQPFPNPIPDANNPGEEKKVVAYQAFVHDRARVVGGASLAQSQLDLANAFVQRAEFIAKYPASLDGPGFVDAILATIKNDLGADLTSQQPALITFFNSGGRAAVLYRLADDNAQANPINNRAFIDAEYNRAFVATQYFGYLRRDPDMAGFLFWLGQVSSAPLRDVPKQHAMVCSFVTSAEYQLRFSSVVTHTNAECQ